MPSTNFNSLKVGSNGGTASDAGTVCSAQSATIAANGTNAVSATLTLPSNAQILDILCDVTTAFDSATSATLSVGVAAAGTDYVSGVNAKTGGRASPALTAAQVSNMASIGSNTSVVATVTPVGATTTGAVRVTVRYLTGN